MQSPPDAPSTGPEPVPLILPITRQKFPTEAFPKAIADMISDVAHFTQVDPAMSGTSALTALAAAACGRAEIEARRGWREPLTLMTATVARPGERKSAVQQFMTRPLLEVERALVATAAGSRLQAETEKAIAVKAAERVKQEAGRTDDPNKRAEALSRAISESTYAENIIVPAVPRLLADDATPEAIASLMAEQGGRLAIISAEGGIFDMFAGRYSSLPNLDPILKGHAGDPLRVDRRGREKPEFIDRPALTIGLMIQPSVLAAIGRQDNFRGRGLLARFLFSIPASKVGKRQVGAASVPPEVEAAYSETIMTIARELNAWSDPIVLTMSKAAAEQVMVLERVIEPHLAEDGDLGQDLREWGSKFVGAVLRIAGLLHLADHAGNLRRGMTSPVEQATFERAITIGGYFRAEAVAAFAEMGTDDATRAATYLLERIRKHGKPTVSLRDLQRIARRFRTKADLEVPVQRLLDSGWLIAEEQPKAQHTGRPAGPIFTVHPDVFGESGATECVA